MALYDIIGRAYAGRRRPDPRIAGAVASALGGSGSVVNVGAGAGSYEPRGPAVVAVEPSAVMVAQRRPGAAPAVRALAERLPFADGAFEAALAVLTVHHWTDRRAGLAEMRRVARGPVVLLTWDPSHAGFWLTRDYFPDMLELDRRAFPTLDELGAALGRVEVSAVTVPHDCVDGFLGAYWRRPAEYLDEGARGAISAFAMVGDVRARLDRLGADLRSGRWAARNADLLGLEELDVGYRLVVGRPAA